MDHMVVINTFVTGCCDRCICHPLVVIHVCGERGNSGELLTSLNYILIFCENDCQIYYAKKLVKSYIILLKQC